MRTRTKIVLFLLYIFIEFYFFIAGAMKDSDILIVLGLLLFLAGIILIITVIIKSIIRRIKNLKKYKKLIQENKLWYDKFIDVNTRIENTIKNFQPPYTYRLNHYLSELVQNENLYRDLANEEVNFNEQLKMLRSFWSRKKYTKISEFDDKRILQLYSNIVGHLCEYLYNNQEPSSEELNFLHSFEKALRLDAFGADGKYLYWKSFGTSVKKSLLANILSKLIENKSLSYIQENNLYKISKILLLPNEQLEKEFPEQFKIINDLSLARTLREKQLYPINSNIEFPLNKGEICYYKVTKALYAKTRCENEKYYPSGKEDECQIYVTNQRFVVWGFTVRSYNLDTIAGIGITDNKYFIYKIKNKEWPFCLIISQPYSLQAVLNRCINLKQ